VSIIKMLFIGIYIFFSAKIVGKVQML